MAGQTKPPEFRPACYGHYIDLNTDLDNPIPSCEKCKYRDECISTGIRQLAQGRQTPLKLT